MTNKVSIQKIVAVSDALLAITDDVKILRNIAWEDHVQQEFFRYDAQRLPFVEYPKYDAAPILARIAAVRKEIAEVPHIKKYASRIADKLESSAYLLATRGTPAFFEHSKDLYGSPPMNWKTGVPPLLILLTTLTVSLTA